VCVVGGRKRETYISVHHCHLDILIVYFILHHLYCQIVHQFTGGGEGEWVKILEIESEEELIDRIGYILFDYIIYRCVCQM
jgi:hypothetical protein